MGRRTPVISTVPVVQHIAMFLYVGIVQDREKEQEQGCQCRRTPDVVSQRLIRNSEGRRRYIRQTTAQRKASF